MTLRYMQSTAEAYEYRLTLRHLLDSAMATAGDQSDPVTTFIGYARDPAMA
jgi:hypothetical protein